MSITSLAQIESWNAAAIRTVGLAATQRAEAAHNAAQTLRHLPAWNTWHSSVKDTTRTAAATTAQTLDGQARNAKAVHNATETAAGDVDRLQARVAELRKQATLLGLNIDNATNQVTPTQEPASPLMMMAAMTTQAAVMDLLAEADRIDSTLAAALIADGESTDAEPCPDDVIVDRHHGPDIQMIDIPGPTATGEDDGRTLADQLAVPPAYRDSQILDQTAAHLPQISLTPEQMDALAQGREVTDLPKETLDYYRDFYATAGKDGLLLLDRRLEAREAAGNTDAANQRDRLANALMLVSNENVVELNPDGTVASRGGYDRLPPDLRQMLEVRRSDATYPDMENLGPFVAKNQHVADTVQFSELVGEANPGYQPGSRLGAEMYLKSADMVSYSLGGWMSTDTPPDVYERAASSLLDTAGRNNEASYQIWSGNGADLPQGYDREQTIRTLIGHDWTKSGGGGSGAATLLDWITEDSQRPIGDPIGDRARIAFTEVPDMLAPSDTDPVWNSQRDAFAHNPAIATEMSQMLAANTDALAAPGQQFGFPETKIDASGHALISADDAHRLLELGSYSEDGRLTLTTAAETARIDELATAMSGHQGNLSDQVANTAAGGLSGRIDSAITDAINHQNQVLGDEVTNPKDALYRAKTAGAEIAGWASNEFVDKIPGAGEVKSMTGFDPREFVENKIKDWIGKPEYQGLTLPDPDNLRASSALQAQQTLLQAAHEAGQLPSTLQTPDGAPVDVATLSPSSTQYQQLQQFLIDRGLTQYVVDYGQSYSIALDGKR